MINKYRMVPFQESDNNVKQADQPFFSIIITTYNRANTIKKALDSLISQTENDWEALIVDDESTDDTYIQILPYLCLNHKIRYIRKVHSGEALSKNAGIYSSAGKYITFLDSDDEYHHIHLKSRRYILLNDPSIEFLHGGVKIIGNQYVPDRFNHDKIIHLSECVIGGTFVIERKVLFQLGGFDKIMLGTDADLYERATAAGIVMKETTIPTYIYHRENGDSITNMLIKSKPDRERIYIDNNIQ